MFDEKNPTSKISCDSPFKRPESCLNRLRVSEDLPAPVLPTIPTFSPLMKRQTDSTSIEQLFVIEGKAKIVVFHIEDKFLL